MGCNCRRVCRPILFCETSRDWNGLPQEKLGVGSTYIQYNMHYYYLGLYSKTRGPAALTHCVAINGTPEVTTHLYFNQFLCESSNPCLFYLQRKTFPHSFCFLLLPPLMSDQSPLPQYTPLNTPGTNTDTV
jgi:hypothetical protein